MQAPDAMKDLAGPQPTEEMQRVMGVLAERKKGQPDRYRVPFEQARSLLIEERKWWLESAPEMTRTEDDVLDVDGRTVRMRRYLPVGADGSTEIVYLHGGGWCVGGIETHDAIVRGLAQACRHPVISVAYSLAPEFPFPAASHDLQALLAHLREQRPPGTRWVVAGDSAGANLALLEAIRARDAAQPMPAALLLLYGAYLPVRDSRSYLAYGDGRFGMSRGAMERYEHHYLGGRTARDVPQAFPLKLPLHGLPPMLIAACELDVLLDDSLELHAEVQAAGSDSVLEVYRGVGHGFLTYGRLMQAPADAFRAMSDFLRLKLPHAVR